jgi:D-lactate dehydrogenase
MSFPNVLITVYQAFFTEEALSEIAKVTLDSTARLHSDTIQKGDKVMFKIIP